MDKDIASLPAGPEEWTNEWYRQQFKRLEYMNRQVVTTLIDELNKVTHQANALRKEVNEMNKARQMDAAKIGELIDDMDVMKTSLDKARDYIKNMNKSGKEVAA